MTYQEIVSEVKLGNSARLPWWPPGSQIRLGNEGDRDYLDFDKVTETIVLDCPTVVSDCIVGVYRPSGGEIHAENWEIVK